MKTILILEDNEDRIAGFERAVAGLGDDFDLKIWRDAPSMISECVQYFSSAVLISLDHDLNPQPGVTTIRDGNGRGKIPYPIPSRLPGHHSYHKH